MTRAEIRLVQVEVAARLRVSCDDYHAHSAHGGCLAGDERDITIAKLCETLLSLHKRIDALRPKEDGDAD